ncbi:hypothetical protein [Dactylosporangium sp. NPDC050588]|uniref:hypothetical protein n=1 Tax=Dactylosporangium sp. NPDC050588 TaxID=3157211 RepID=UPI0033F10E74
MRRQFVVLAAVVIGLAGCGSGGGSKASQGASSSPSPQPPPKVAGKLLVTTTGGLKLLTQEADGHLSIAPFDVPRSSDFEYEVTADHKTFVYRSGKVVTARAIADGSERKVAGDASTNKLCLRTSPDSKRVSYLRGEELVVADFAGKVTVVDKVKSAKYTLGATTVTATTELDCGEWLDDTHLKFDRRKSIPDSISVDITATAPVIKADTTTVAVLGGKTPKLVDSPSMWHPTAECGKRVAATAGSTKDALHLRERTGDAELSKAGTFTGSDIALAGTTGGTHSVLFAPGSCRPVLYTMEKRTFQSIDPATRAIGAEPIVTLPDGGIDVRLYDDPQTWQPVKDAEVLAAVVDKQIVIVDLAARTAKLVPADGLDASARVMAWLP